jgi:hypothetical protein
LVTGGCDENIGIENKFPFCCGVFVVALRLVSSLLFGVESSCLLPVGAVFKIIGIEVGLVGVEVLGVGSITITSVFVVFEFGAFVIGELPCCDVASIFGEETLGGSVGGFSSGLVGFEVFFGVSSMRSVVLSCLANERACCSSKSVVTSVF